MSDTVSIISSLGVPFYLVPGNHDFLFLSREEKKALEDQTKYDFRIYKTDTLKSFQELIDDNDPKYLFTEEEELAA